MSGFGLPKRLYLHIDNELKTESSVRTLPLIPRIEKMLRERKELEEYYSELLGDDFDRTYDGFVCRDNTGKLITPYYASSHFRIVIRNAGLKHIRFHDLRHLNPPFSQIYKATLLRHFISLHPKQSCRYLIAGLFLYHIIVFVQL